MDAFGSLSSCLLLYGLNCQMATSTMGFYLPTQSVAIRQLEGGGAVSGKLRDLRSFELYRNVYQHSACRGCRDNVKGLDR